MPAPTNVVVKLLEGSTVLDQFSHPLPAAIADAISFYELTGNQAPELTAEAQIADGFAEVTAHAGPFTFTPYKVQIGALNITAQVDFE